MTYEANAYLEKYEIKKPDYDCVSREDPAAAREPLQPLRYARQGDQWTSVHNRPRLFGRKKARIMFTGDITCFEKQFEEAQTADGYDFSYQLDQVRPIFAKADLVVGNLETMIFPEAPYRTEKYVAEQNFHCNAPVAFLDALRHAGFDVLTNANNHDLDTGAVGIGATIDHVERKGFIQTGTFKTDKKRYEIINVGGMRIGIVAFATEHNNKKSNLTQEGVEFLLNDYSRERAGEILRQARNDGAELVFVCIHWGKENKLVQNKQQEETAAELAGLGYDCIIGSHPHVLEPFSYVKAGGREVPVFYSMGNFLSHNVGNQKARSIIACIDLEKDKEGIHMTCSYIPIYTSKNYGQKKYVVLPIPVTAVDPRSLQKRNAIRKVVGTRIENNREILFTECIERVELPQDKQLPDMVDIDSVSVFPVTYDDGKFVYSVYRPGAKIAGMSEFAASSSYSIPAKVGSIPVTGLRKGALSGNKIMKKLNFGSNITVIGEAACKDVPQLEGFQLGRNVTEIQAEAFAGCTMLTAAVMRKKVKKIGSRAFQGCTSLRSVKLPRNVEEIAEDAFDGCSNAVFYCEPDSYAEQYAQKHNFKVVRMTFVD